MSTGPVGENYPYGNQSDYQNSYYYQNSRYYRQPSYQSGYGYQQQNYGQYPQSAYGQKPPVPAQSKSYVPSAVPMNTVMTPSTSTVTGSGSGNNNGVQSSDNGDKPKTASDSPGKELIGESQSLQAEVQSDAKSVKSEGVDGGGGGGGGEAMQAISVLMTVAGVVTSMDLIAKALIVTGFIMKTVGQGLEIAGTAMDASGMAMIASGQALCSNPFTLAVGLAMISAGTALKVAGTTMKVAGKVLKTVGTVMEKTARALEKALKVMMRGAKNVARKGMNKFRKMKMARASKAAKKNKLKAQKAKAKAKKHGAAGDKAKAAKYQVKAKKYKSQQQKYRKKNHELYNANVKTNNTIAKKAAKNKAAKAELKNSFSNGISKAKAAPGQTTSNLSKGVKKQWAIMKDQGKLLGSNSTKAFSQNRSGMGAALRNSKTNGAQSWKAANTKSTGASKFATRKNKVKQNYAGLKADFKSSFRTTKPSKLQKAKTYTGNQWRSASGSLTKFKKTKGTQPSTKANTVKPATAIKRKAVPVKRKAVPVNPNTVKPATAIKRKVVPVNANTATKPLTEAQKKLAAKCDDILKKKPEDRTPAEKMMLEHYQGTSSAGNGVKAASGQSKDDLALVGSKNNTSATKGQSKDDMALNPNASGQKLSKDDLALNPKTVDNLKNGKYATAQKPGNLKTSTDATRFDRTKAARWAVGGGAIAVGGAMIASAYAPTSSDPLALQGTTTDEEFHEKYDDVINNATAGWGDYKSGYYDPQYLPPGGSYYGNPDYRVSPYGVPGQDNFGSGVPGYGQNPFGNWRTNMNYFTRSNQNYPFGIWPANYTHQIKQRQPSNNGDQTVLSGIGPYSQQPYNNDYKYQYYG